MENKKTILVVGNGFDLAIGRKTSYWDFYESEYCPKRYPAPIIAYLNQKLDNQNIKWLDLETALQNYALECKKTGIDEDFFSSNEIEALKHIYGIRYISMEKLASTVIEMESKGKIIRDKKGNIKLEFSYDELKKEPLERDRIALRKIEEGLGKYLNDIEQEKSETHCFAGLLMQIALNNPNATIYSFNYTNISKLYTDSRYQAEDFDEKIHYVHGSLKDDHIIIGAKDGDYGNYDFVQKAFSPHYASTQLVKDLLEADDVHIYGHSLGDCDSQYFAPFFLQQVQPNASRKSIAIYTYNEKSKEEIKKNINKLTGNLLSNLYSMNEFNIFTQEEMDAIYENMKKIAMAKKV